MSGISGSVAPLAAGLDDIAEIGQYLPGAVAAIKEELRQSTAAHESPKGEKWAPRKLDGSAPLDNAFAAIDVRQITPTKVAVELTGHHVFHHYGAGGKPVREIIPTEITQKLGNAIAAGIVKPPARRAK